MNSKLNILGLVGSGDVHSSLNHLNALADFCEREKLTNVCFHLFTDGRDAPPTEAKDIISKLEVTLKAKKIGRIASISGRYYAMDRDRHWERTEKAYNAIVLGKGNYATSALEAIELAYQKGQTDEFIEPAVIVDNGKPIGTIDTGDAAIFFNFRVDRSRQLCMSLTIKDFENLKEFEFEEEMLDQHEHDKSVKFTGRTFKRERFPENLFFVTMTQYQATIPVSAVAFPPEIVVENLSQAVSQAGLKQLHLTESEKEKMLTFYFNGMQSIKYPGEDDKIVNSPKVATFDQKPEMSLFKLVGEFNKALAKDYYHFIVMNFANPDMVAHSGDLRATIKACEYVDKAIYEVATQVLSRDGTLLITADHGNAEELLTFPTTNYFFTTSAGSINTEHSNNPVPVIIINKGLTGRGIVLPKGALSDIAPTILSLLNVAIPAIMKGKSLLPQKNV